MKHTYIRFAVAAALLAFTSLDAQQTTTDDGRVHTASAVLTTGSSAAGTPASLSCDSLGTTLAAGNGNDGVMFDVVALQNTRITYLDAKLLPTAVGTIKIYYRMGSHINHEGTPADWTFIDSCRVATVASGINHLPIYINLTVNAGDTIAFYVTANLDGQSVDYTNGTTLSAVHRQDTYIKVLEGTGVSFPFAGTFTPRIFNGAISYCDANYVMTCDSLNTSFSSNNGNDGNMFDVVVGSSDVTIQRLWGNINGSGWWMVYYRIGGYAGHENTPGDWILIDSTFVVSAGADVPTLIGIDMDLYVPAGTTISFYSTGNGTGADVNYFGGTTEGAVFRSDANLSIKEGKGNSWPFAGFFDPRVWSGGIDYCVGPTGVNESLNTAAGWSAQVVPNPAADQAELQLMAPGAVQNATVRILDINGREVAAVSSINTNRVSLPVSALAAGVYFYQLTDANGAVLVNGKFVRQ